MTLPSLAGRSLWNRRFPVILTMCTIAVSIALLVLVEHLREEVREGFYRSVSGTDLIVGARTAPVQLLLVSVFGIGHATNAVSWQTYRELADTDRVAWAVPLLLGDAHQGHRVAGTTPAFFEQFRYGDSRALEIARGETFTDLFNVVLGAGVAQRLGYETGDEIELAHGGGNVSLHHHDEHPFTVRGILEPTGTPVDETLWIPMEAYPALHAGWISGTPRPGAGISADEARERADDGELVPDEVTAIFLGLDSRAAAFGLQRRINDYAGEPLTAIMPGLTLQELWRITGVAERVLQVVAWLVVAAGLLGMVTVLLSTLNERRREMAILRAVGARPWQIAGLLVTEAGVIVISGIAAGVLLAVAAQVVAAPLLLEHVGIYMDVAWPDAGLWTILAAVFAAGLLAALVPAALAYRRTLADGMQVRA